MAVLADGPWARHTYWRSDLEAMQEASRSMGYADEHPSAVLRRYHPTEDYQSADDGDGTRLWRFC